MANDLQIQPIVLIDNMALRYRYLDKLKRNYKMDFIVHRAESMFGGRKCTHTIRSGQVNGVFLCVFVRVHSEFRFLTSNLLGPKHTHNSTAATAG